MLVTAASYLAADRPDIQYGAQDLCHQLALTKSSVARVKRFAHCLAVNPGIVWGFGRKGG